MIRKLLLAAALGAGLIASSGALAQKLEYDCDTTPEHFSELKLAANAEAHGVSAAITARELYKSKEFAPLGSLQLVAVDGSWRVRIALSGTAKTGTKAMLATLTVFRGDDRQEQQLGLVDASGPLAASLAIGAGGRGTATLGGKSVSFDAPPGRATASVICSTGDFLFADLAFN